MTVEDDTPGVATSDEEGSVPEGATYPFNSKKLVVSLLRRLAAMLKILLYMALHYNLLWILTSVFKQKLLIC